MVNVNHEVQASHQSHTKYLGLHVGKKRIMMISLQLSKASMIFLNIDIISLCRGRKSKQGNLQRLQKAIPDRNSEKLMILCRKCVYPHTGTITEQFSYMLYRIV